MHNAQCTIKARSCEGVRIHHILINPPKADTITVNCYLLTEQACSFIILHVVFNCYFIDKVGEWAYNIVG